MTRISFKDSVLCATRGLFSGFSSERNLKIQLLISTIVIAISLLSGISKLYLITIIIVCFLVMILELFNRGFEKLIDLISPEYNREFGKVKDAMAGVVLLTFTMAMTVSLLILYQPVMRLLQNASQFKFFIPIMIANVGLVSIIALILYFKKRQT